MAADLLASHGWNAQISFLDGEKRRVREVKMGVLVILACWATCVLYFFGRKILGLYDVLVSLVTHFTPLGPILLIGLAVVLIVLLAPKRTAI